MALAFQGSEVLSDDDTIAISSTPEDMGVIGDGDHDPDDPPSQGTAVGTRISRNVNGNNGHRNSSFQSNYSAFNFDASVMRQSSVNGPSATVTSARASAQDSEPSPRKVTKLSSQYKRAKAASKQ